LDKIGDERVKQRDQKIRKVERAGERGIHGFETAALREERPRASYFLIF
jgi:hypothetical protein